MWNHVELCDVLYLPLGPSLWPEELQQIPGYCFRPPHECVYVCFKIKLWGSETITSFQPTRDSASQFHQDSAAAAATSLLWPSHKSADSAGQGHTSPVSSLRFTLFIFSYCDSVLYLQCCDNICKLWHLFIYSWLMLNVMMATAQTERTAGNLGPLVRK